MTLRSSRPATAAVRVVAVLCAAALALTLPSTPAGSQQEDGTQACPVDAPAQDFADRGNIPAAHLGNVDCAGFFEIVLGFADGGYRPRAQVRRDQMASFIARTLDAADVELPPADEGREFADVGEDNPHAENIRRLEAAGIVEGGPLDLGEDAYGPGLPTRRDQMTSLIMRAGEWAFDLVLVSDTQRFDDVPEGNVHFERVNFAAEHGIVLGFGGGTFGPGEFTRRDQMASFVVRLLNLLATPASVAVTDQSHETQALGETITVTATVFTQFRDEVQETGGDARAGEGREVTFRTEHGDESGAVTPASQTVTTDTNGEADFSFSTADAGTVSVTASMRGLGGAFAHGDDDRDRVEKSFVEILPGEPVALDLTPASARNLVGRDHSVTATATDVEDDPADGAAVRFEVYRATADGHSLVDVDQSETGADGTTGLTYPGPSVSTEDTIVSCVVGEEADPAADEPFCAEVTDNGDVALRNGVIGDEATKTWIETGSISGAATTAAGLPALNATVTFQGPTDGSDQTDTSGAYQSDPLLPGEYTVSVDEYDCDDEPRAVTVGSGEDVTGVDFANCSNLTAPQAP